jgi:hypothetical protein
MRHTVNKAVLVTLPMAHAGIGIESDVNILWSEVTAWLASMHRLGEPGLGRWFRFYSNDAVHAHSNGM